MVFDRLVQCARWQKLMGGFPSGVDRLIVTDKPQNTVDAVPVIVEPEAENGGLFNLSRMRNRLLMAARDGGYDGLMILEADFVVLKWFTRFPETWAIPYAAYDRLNDLPEPPESLMDIPRCWEWLGPRGLIPVHCVLLNRSVFSEVSWDENFVGVGYDDWDFNNLMTKRYGRFELVDCFLMHRWHPSTGRTPRPENKAYYESKWGKIPG